MKNLRWLKRVLLLLILTALPAFAENVSTMPAPTGYVDDYAGVISSAARSEMEDLSRELHQKTRAQIFLVTIKTTEGEPVETFANQLFAKWKIGEKKTDRGVLLLFAIRDRKRWIEIGYGLEGILNDAKVGDIGREMVPALRAAHYDEATRIGLQEISRVIAADAGVTLNGLDIPLEQENQTAPPTAQPVPSSQIPQPGRILFVFIFLPIFFIVASFLLIMNGLRRGRATGSFDGGRNFGSDNSSSDDSFSGGDGGSSGGGGAGGDW